MKSTGVVRKLDNLGRVVIPIELRKTMGIAIKDTLEIFTEGDEIILKKYHPSCVFCSDARDVVPYKGKLVCKKCLDELKAAKEAILSSLRATHDSPGAIEGYYATAALSGMGLTPAQYMAALESVTLEQVVAAANTIEYHSSFFLKGVNT